VHGHREQVARLAASGIRPVIDEFRADTTTIRKDGSASSRHRRPEPAYCHGYGPGDCPDEDAVDCDRLGGYGRAGLVTVVVVVAVVMVVVALVVAVAVEVPPARFDWASPPRVVAVVLDERPGASAGGDEVVGVRPPAGVDEPRRAVEPPSKVVRSAAVASEWCTNSSATVSAAPPIRNAAAVITITRLTRAGSPRLTRPRSASAAEGTPPARRSRTR
jgi:hypothetical protein